MFQCSIYDNENDDNDDNDMVLSDGDENKVRVMVIMVR